MLDARGKTPFLMAWSGVLLLAALPALGAGPSSFDECDTLVREKPELTTSYECYEDRARADGEFDEAVRRLEALLQIHPDRHYAWSVLGTLARHRGDPRAEELFRHAATLAEENGDPTGVIKARASLGTLLRKQGRLEEAEVELELALAAAEEKNHPYQLAYVWMKQGWLARERYDYGLAKRYFLQAEEAVFPDGPNNLKASTLAGLGSICWRLGQYEAAMRYHRRAAAAARERGDTWGEASSMFNMAAAAQSMERNGNLTTEELGQFARQALDAARAAGNRRIVANARLLLTEIGMVDDPRTEFGEILSVFEASGDWKGANQALRSLGYWHVESGPEGEAEGFRLIDRAVDDARARGGGIHLYRSLWYRAEALYLAGRPREEWIAAYLELLEELERLRELQPEAKVRARTFSRFTTFYYSLARRLLETLDRSASPGEDLDLAFRTVERMFARLLLDSLEMAGVETAESEAERARAEFLKELATVQKELMRPELSEKRRQEQLDALQALEKEEELLLDRMAHERAKDEATGSAAVASITEVQQQLGEDQALLAYQLSSYTQRRETRFEGTHLSWAFAITHETVEVFPMPDYIQLKNQVRLYNGLLRKRDGSEAAAAERLERELLEPILRSLPDKIKRLVIVPEGPLHELPFGTLLSRDRESLAERFEITHTPSATLWTRWKQSESPAGAGELLSFADPQVGGKLEASAERAADPWLEGLRLGPLPYSRKEALSVLRQLGSGEVRIGPEASEEYIKEIDLGEVGILHFAAHAVVDEERPERSAVVLAPGGGKEDGLLQVREIVDLDLSNQLVILTSCRSARGEALAGEGVVSLAHAFFQSGARAIIASLRPLRDDETAALMEALSKRLSRGASVAEALAGAQREMIASGLPAAAWSGLVVLGDGDLVPLAGGTPFRFRGLPLAITCAAVFILLGLALLLWRGRRARAKR